MINVTKTYLPNREKYKNYIDQIFDSGWITNNGEFTRELTNRLARYLGVKNLLLVSNGTLALQVAYKLLGLKGDVITTPFSFVATTSSLVWEGLNPIFVDIDMNSFNMDPQKIEVRITEATSSIVPVHVFGNPCNVEAIGDIAKKHKISVIYDAAHAFDVKYKDGSVLNYGDVSILSFHATKTFHTIEGGALIINDDELFEKAKWMINFGIQGPSKIVGLGINAKMNEFQAAMGLCLLDDIEYLNQERKTRHNRYLQALQDIRSIRFPARNPDGSDNHSYFPVVFETESILLDIIEDLKYVDIFPRRYFHPSLESLNYLAPQEAPISSDISKRILCLPLFSELDDVNQERIINIVRQRTS
ncbi:DegT/DnrJ/EryC1/StrS aminotransferase family protein [Cohnella sp. REN36]|uniref:DegT/DnrJ/EryC1/StrS family aminotransferase n=1 Tax=Cohnella sp. REN36 TaxID=2887347 RepID=UPI001D15B945|nr:DegT/DnrJ/EryC1/StrS family aminotransferase [Cohnella sp. REN36]MCC3374064.1 DegT/DnrJ/EryC1/StrS family aminotransferase [Cohnella sp. REN36]